jgi:inner membrane protein
MQAPELGKRPTIGRMDSITHLFAGAAIAAAIAPAQRRRAAMLVGAIAGSLPDVDNLVLMFAEPVARFVEHRGPTHSLVLLPLYAIACWWLLRFVYAASREAPLRWLLVCLLTLLSHVLLDAATVYGTRLFWPIDRTPVMGASLFIVDPLLTLPLVVGCVLAFFMRAKPQATAWVTLLLALSATYVGWSLVAKQHIESTVRAHFAQRTTASIDLLTVPTPFNTLVWRVLVSSKEGYYEGYYSFLRGGNEFRLDHYPGERSVPAAIASSKAFTDLVEFTRGYYRIDRRAGRYVFVDLRMGGEPDYLFRFEVGEGEGESAKPLAPATQLPIEPGMLARSWRRFSPMLFARAATPAAG